MTACNKEDTRSDLCDTDLVIGKTTTPAIVTLSSGIVFSYESYGANLCYSFSGTAISQKAGNIYEIRSKGKVPCKPTICAQAIYQVNDTQRILTPLSGTYYLQFYNENSLFKTDTVHVN